MPLDYFLTENRLTDRPDDMTAIAQSGASIDENGLIDRILAMIPALTAGNYQVKVVTQYANGVRLIKTPKVFVYPKSLLV